MERDERLEPDPQFVRRLEDWFVAELGRDRSLAGPEPPGEARINPGSDGDAIPLETPRPPDRRRFRMAFAAAAALVALAVVGILVLPGRDEPAAVPVTVDGAELDGLCAMLGAGYPQWALDPDIDELPHVRARLRDRFDAVLRKIAVLGRRDRVDLTALEHGLVAARVAVDDLDATAIDANIDRRVSDVDTLVARWVADVAARGGDACAPPRLGAALTPDEAAVRESFRLFTDQTAPVDDVAAMLGGTELLAVREQLGGLLRSAGGVAHPVDVEVTGDTATMRYEVRSDVGIPGGELVFDRSATPVRWTLSRSSLCAIAARYEIGCPAGGSTQQGPGG